MNPNPNVFAFFSHASVVVQLVMLSLLAASVLSWTLILQRSAQFRHLRRMNHVFNKQWQAKSTLAQHFQSLHHRATSLHGLARQFHAGYQSWQRAHKNTAHNHHDHWGSMQRAMHIARQNDLQPLANRLTIQATIGSVSPYVGLFGTVWGIMTAFMSLGQAQQTTIAMVAPGIAEALIATAMGLFAAIPAVIAYNQLSQQLNHFSDQGELLQVQLQAAIETQDTAAQTTHGDT